MITCGRLDMIPEAKPNDILKNIRPPEGADSLYPSAGPLYKDNPVRLSILRQLEGRSVLSARQFSHEQIVEIAKLAALLETTEVASHHPLDGKLVITAFFEPSTRTRLSFESSILRLDGKVISIPEGKVTGVAKGESLSDIGEMFNAYGDVVIMRHTETDSIDELRKRLRIPLVNAGNGTGEHPTQALADWYALLKWRPSLMNKPVSEKDKLHVGIIGTPGSMRAVKSFLLLALNFKEHIRQVTVVSEMADPFSPELVEDLAEAGIEYSTTHDLATVVSVLDVIYMNSITMVGDSYKNLDSRFSVSGDSQLKEEAVVLHPLARLNELDESLDDTPHNLYFSQAHGAVFVRQALLMAILGRLDRLPPEIPTED